MNRSNTRRHMSRLESLAEYGADKPAYAARLQAFIDEVKAAKGDRAKTWSTIYKAQRDVAGADFRFENIGPDGIFFMVFMELSFMTLDEPDVGDVLEQYEPQRKAIWSKYGWPEDDEDGDTWDPRRNLPEGDVPEDFTAYDDEAAAKLEAAEKTARRRVFGRFGVGDILDLLDDDPDEFDRRMKAGRTETGWDKVVDSWGDE